MEREWIVRYREVKPNGQVVERLRLTRAKSHWSAKRRVKRAKLRPRTIVAARAAAKDLLQTCS